MTQLERLKNCIRKFESLQRTFASQGAGDTEPDALFQFLLKQAVTGAAVVVPSTVRGWELYRGVSDSEKAAKELHKCATEAVTTIHDCTYKDLKALQAYLMDYCWRTPF